METTGTTTEKEITYRMYCATCGEEILCYDDGTTSVDYDYFEDSENTPYCRECYDEECARREAQERADVEQYFNDKNKIEIYISDDVAYACYYDKSGRNIKSANKFLVSSFSRVEILPQIGLIKEEERISILSPK